ncbi:MAG: cytochrome c/FTR1 family iron permease [Betaproteobacteria bacterium]|nr:cytochrome c/FTR1 family iron permease [Betaproteobacteria bacterium]
MFARLLAILLLALAVTIPRAALAQAPGEAAQTVVHLLDYVGVDYPGFVRDGKVLNEQEYKEQVEFTRQVGELLAKLPPADGSARLAEDAAMLRKRIEAKAPGEEVSRLANALRWEVIAAYKLTVTPKRAPDFKLGAQRYAAVCAGCHGVQGRGDGPAAKDMKPAPADFHGAWRMSQRSVYGLYSTISLGVGGTPMAAFQQLSEDERWALAFYVASLGADTGTLEKGRALWEGKAGRATFKDLREVSTLTDAEVLARHGVDAAAVFAYLKSRPEALASSREAPLDVAQRLLAESLAALRAGEPERAHRLALGAYLEGFEPAEPALDALDRALRLEIEAHMMTYRNLLRASGSITPAEAQQERLRALLGAAAEKIAGTELSPSAVAFSAFIIILREGLEAILVLAAILAFAARSGRPAARRYVHAGWIAAFVLGLATWAAASTLIEVSGANRELTEGVTALIASAMLLYVGFWLHDKTHAKAWANYIREQAGSALGAGTLWSLALLAFFAVYRELFEIVLFSEALWAQAGPAGHGALAAGATGGAAILAIVGLLIFRFGLRLPIGPFFAVCAVLLVILAIAFAGQGVAALQAAGLIAADPIAFVNVPMLGIFPTAQTLAAQAAVLAVVIAAFAWSRAVARKGAPAA